MDLKKLFAFQRSTSAFGCSIPSALNPERGCSMMFAVSIVIAAIVIPIPMVVVLATAVVAVPISDKESLAVVPRFDPVCSGIWWASPVAFMPFVVVADRVPITLNPYVTGARARWNHSNYARGWWSTNPNPDAYLTNCQTR